ncbi:MAG TPA: DNA-processing protein DprA, partial [Gemmatimonadaceae bacterium]|nr:DNA-processing protein DprA [Gemmatimonadaceae bacterium]
MNAPRPASSFPDQAPPTIRVVRGDARYPAELEDLRENAPAALWARGSLDVLNVQPRVAIVGTRRMTHYGERVTKELAGAFARAGACVVSGLAAGVDGTAHRATLDANAVTIAVLGTGINKVFPKSHHLLQATIAQRGLLLSELEPDDHGMKFTFP